MFLVPEIPSGLFLIPPWWRGVPKDDVEVWFSVVEVASCSEAIRKRSLRWLASRSLHVGIEKDQPAGESRILSQTYGRIPKALPSDAAR